jgi:5-formyltetrahydrofolate cyclo-ligase
MENQTARDVLRTTVREKVRKMSPEERREASERIFKQVTALPEYQQSRSLMVFASMSDEPDTFNLMAHALRAGKRIWLPWCETSTLTIIPVEIRDPAKDLANGAYGILEPREPARKEIPPDFNPDVVFVPGAVFDGGGNRLGRGLGYYDKFLARLGAGMLKIGLGFACQTAGAVPRAEGDIKMDRVIFG